MLDSVTISAPSRLHFGLFSIGDLVERKFGGVGLMIDSPRTIIKASAAERFRITGDAGDASGAAIEHWFDRTGIATVLPDIQTVDSLPVALELVSVPRRHAGLGTGTQIALCSAMAVSKLLGLPTPGPDELPLAVGRGKRSAIGSYGFFRGGFLVDRGKLAGEAIAPLDFQTSFPEPWSIVTVILDVDAGLSGPSEVAAFFDLSPTTDTDRNAMIELVRSKIIPGINRQDYDQFAEGIYEFGRRSGMMFADIQNGPYNGAEIEALVDQIRGFGVPAVGQSSWGPCVFSITRNDDQAQSLATFLKSKYGNRGQIQIAKADNDGAVVVDAHQTT